MIKVALKQEVYFFIKCQLEYLLYNETDDIYFINILDGDTCFNSMDKFNYLLNKKEYKKIYLHWRYI